MQEPCATPTLQRRLAEQLRVVLSIYVFVHRIECSPIRAYIMALCRAADSAGCIIFLTVTSCLVLFRSFEASEVELHCCIKSAYHAVFPECRITGIGSSTPLFLVLVLSIVVKSMGWMAVDLKQVSQPASYNMI